MAASFATSVSFITADPRAGCGWPPEKVEALIKDPATLAMWREAVTPEVRANQHTKGNDNVITQQGNSKSYTLDRLKREAPSLFERVCAAATLR